MKLFISGLRKHDTFASSLVQWTSATATATALFCAKKRVSLFVFLTLGSSFITDPPRIVTVPKDQVVQTERVASFICTAIGKPQPMIEWRKNGKRLVTLRYTVLEIPNGSVLRIEPVRPGRDNATYECLAENGIGEPVREQADLTVLSGMFCQQQKQIQKQKQ